jgi:hypothetical protein
MCSTLISISSSSVTNDFHRRFTYPTPSSTSLEMVSPASPFKKSSSSPATSPLPSQAQQHTAPSLSLPPFDQIPKLMPSAPEQQPNLVKSSTMHMPLTLPSTIVQLLAPSSPHRSTWCGPWRSSSTSPTNRHSQMHLMAVITRS